MICIQEKATVWSSVYDWTVVGELSAGDEVISAGPAEQSEGYWMLPVEKPSGVVDARSLKPLPDQP